MLLEAVEGMRWIIRYGVLIRAMYDQQLQFNILEYGLQGSRVIMVDSVQCPVTSLQHEKWCHHMKCWHVLLIS